MFDYSMEAFKVVLEDLKKWGKGLKISFSVLTLLYLGYVLIAGVGIFAANIILISLYGTYTIFQIIMSNNKKGKKKKKAEKVIARTYKWTKLLINAITLISLLYGIYVATSNVNGISIILATLTIIVWVLQVLIEILILIVEPKVKLIRAGLIKDTKFFVSAYNKIRLINNEDELVDFDTFDKDFEKELKVLNARVDENKKKRERRFTPQRLFNKDDDEDFIEKAKRKTKEFFGQFTKKDENEVLIDDEEEKKKKK